MQESKWSPSQESVPSYTSYPPSLYRDVPAPHPNVSMASTEATPSGDVSIPGLMSLTQPETPRPDVATATTNTTTSLPPTPIASSSSSRSPSNSTSSGEGGAGARPNLPTRPASFTSMTSFPSHPYHQFAGPIRKRRAESIFSFEMGPSFSSTEQLHDLVSLDQTNGFQVQLHAKMDRGFFRADQDWACYRRNYFQVSSTFDVHGVNYLLQGPEVPCLLRQSDQLHQVEFFSIGASACVSGKPDKKIELVMMTPKRDKGPQMMPRPQPVRAGGNLHLASVGSSHHIVTFERMQFKTATANNGKRRAAQQYYEIIIDLFANTSQGQQIRVATCHSAPLVVRGRSPGHYADSHTRYRHNSMASSTGGDVAAAAAATGLPSHQDQHAAAIVGSNNDHRLPPPPPPPQAGRYMSLPTSPVSDLGPYSPYYGYPPPLASGYPPSSPSHNSNNYTIPSQQQQAQAATTPSSSHHHHHHPDYFHQPPSQQQQQQPDYYTYKDFSQQQQQQLGYPPTGVAPPPPLQQHQLPPPPPAGNPYQSYTPYPHSSALAPPQTTAINNHPHP
ncbi:ndt80 like dna-binding family protein [Lichtheimia corymbifera JMRC:FSU:9682]|uniref:Ndt80 like dna-binding family protein n=1 Tax=Lichtheimia corymbifera JMRC:FSU:9682 TaxID=1263082 RepID=A0A068RF65_9FUNG|nr:ndt80 like dna-binding family protein [Lichtheimia corymbifera JMRC:FSU:9682]